MYQLLFRIILEISELWLRATRGCLLRQRLMPVRLLPEPSISRGEPRGGESGGVQRRPQGSTSPALPPQNFLL
ncbi:hypothetical protein V5799_006303 [Amblyomma americanum]|uniref:Uncharacterized protein n=1 Tax=Amblyomma americanum TaxID=6943 RepID=A0AAQ4DWS9_AMBAM